MRAPGSKDHLDLAGLFAGSGRPLNRFKHRERESIFARGDAADAVFYVEQGAVKKIHASKDGNEGIIVILKPQAFFGSGCIVGERQRRTTAIAVIDCTIPRIEKQRMTDELQRNAQLVEVFLGFLVAQSEHYEEALADHLFLSSKGRRHAPMSKH